ncbi:hypothetical protein N7E81_08935 [Reichenbachiella carrageenanivorans]|uniref:MG2 domain-containing protein n=1 Tax=Reichenbachiella carrageenanivorans TaxID=2979869 RepID=A0ABY6D5N0_9BACT|nr:hypothetical protein [Reichenbachiella carrageenanivorans]UXX81219.1 hypothetical protein N7E81_08935 [Reichenbachiella carrageenanivorans]
MDRLMEGAQKNIFLMLLLWLVLMWPTQVKSQQNIEERVYVHLNNQTLITGETLNFSVFCLSDKTQKMSPLSKVLYIEIFGADGVVHQDKISLTDGRGHGEFFVASHLSTGKYQLVAYTRWMKNFEKYCQLPLTIVNPFKEYEQPDDTLAQGGTLINWYPQGLTLTADVTNTVRFRLKSAPEKLEEGFEIKILGAAGEIELETKHDSFGVGQFEITPKLGEHYRVLLEDKSGQFQFYELPKVLGAGMVNTSNPKRVYAEWSLPHLSTLDFPLAEKYRPRQQVQIQTELAAGTYSVSVNKKSESLPYRHHRAVWSKWHAPNLEFVVDPEELWASLLPPTTLMVYHDEQIDSIYAQVSLLPEYREEFLDGLLTKDSGAPMGGVLVALSIPGEVSQVRVAKTKADGTFSLPFESTIINAEGYLSVLDADASYQLKVADPFLATAPDFNYEQLKLDSIQIQEIISRSIRNQIENAYYQPSSDTLLRVNEWRPQVSYNYHYVLDEYVRFRTIEETITEFVTTVNVRKGRDPKIKVFLPQYTNTQVEYPRLLLLNGIPVSEDQVLDFSPYKVESISVLNNRYYLGPLVADGVVSFKTKEAGLGGFVLDENYVRTEVKQLAMPKHYKFPIYQSGVVEKRPDQRDQLYWDPLLQVDEKQSINIQFYASDVIGDFQILIEGFTSEGKAVSISDTFEVSEAIQSSAE